MRSLFLGALAFVALAAPLAAQSDLEGRAMPSYDVVLVAHRGLAPDLPENTMAAFEDVAERGVGVIEIDLRGTKDGEVVIMHDETVDRTTNGSGETVALTLAEIKELDAGIKTGDAFAGQEVPTFEEALEFAQQHGVMLLLDIKESEVLDRERIVRLTEKHDAVLNVIVGVRSLEDLEEFHALNPSLRTLGFIPNPQAIDDFAAGGVNIIRLWPDWIRGENTGERADIEGDCLGKPGCLVERVAAHGLPVWTTAGKAGRAELIDLIELGAAGILTDVPDTLADLLDDIDAIQPTH